MKNQPLLPKQRNQDIVIHHRDLSEEDLKRVIRDMNLKVTEQRMVILKSLHEGPRHVTAQELFERLAKEHPDIGFATVYRFLRSMTETGHVTEVRMGGLPARYELSPKEDHHDHLTCTNCGRICEFENRAIEEMQERVAKEFGFKLTDHVLELYGLCPNCQS